MKIDKNKLYNDKKILLDLGLEQHSANTIVILLS